MSNKELPEIIFDLLATKSFEDLGEQEKSIVLKHLSKKEFNEMRSVISDFQTIDQSKKVAFEAFTTPKEKTTLWKNILYFPVPAYVAASILLFAIASFSFFCSSSKSEKIEKEKRIQVKQNGKSIEEESYPEDLIFTL